MECTVAEAKRDVKRRLAEHGLFNRVTGHTVSFSDLARARKAFVTVHDWLGASTAVFEHVKGGQGYVVRFSGPGIIG